MDWGVTQECHAKSCDPCDTCSTSALGVATALRRTAREEVL